MFVSFIHALMLPSVQKWATGGYQSAREKELSYIQVKEIRSVLPKVGPCGLGRSKSFFWAQRFLRRLGC